MKLSNETKQVVISGLLVKALKKHVQPMNKAIKALDALWREAISLETELVLPEVQRSRWPDLLQSNMLRKIQGTMQVRRHEPRNASYAAAKDNTTDRGLGEILIVYTGLEKERSKQRAKYVTVKQAMDEAGWGFVLSSIDFDLNGNTRADLSYKAKFYDIPYPGHVGLIDEQMWTGREDKSQLSDLGKAWSVKAEGLVKKADELVAKVHTVVVQAIGYYDELGEVFMALNTDKALIEHFPEAAKFLPEPVVKRQAVMPADLIQKARKMLVDGIPN